MKIGWKKITMAGEEYEREGDDYKWVRGIPDEEQALLPPAEGRLVDDGTADAPVQTPVQEKVAAPVVNDAHAEQTLPAPGVHGQSTKPNRNCDVMKTARTIMRSDFMQHPLVKGMVFLVVSPIVMTGGILYGTGSVLLGLGDIMTGGPWLRRRVTEHVQLENVVRAGEFARFASVPF